MTRSEKTRQRILEAAETEFSEMGLHGARVDAIAQRAQVNKRMIYAYFTNKEKLYVTVLTGVYGRMAQAEGMLLQESLSPEEMIRRIIQVYFAFLQENPSFVRMLMWENLNHAGFIRGSEADILKAPSLKILAQIIAQGIETGIFRSDIDVENTVLSINMICFSYFSNIHTMSYLLHRDLTEEASIASYAAHTTEMILQFLRPHV